MTPLGMCLPFNNAYSSLSAQHPLKKKSKRAKHIHNPAQFLISKVKWLFHHFIPAAEGFVDVFM